MGAYSITSSAREFMFAVARLLPLLEVIACSGTYRIRLGNHSEMTGKATRMASLTTSATMNGSTP